MRQLDNNRTLLHQSSLLASLLSCVLFVACRGGEDASVDSVGTSIDGPIVSLIDPVSGDLGGGTLVTLSGSGFIGGTDVVTVVTFGAVQATDVTVIDDATITCLTPQGAAAAEVAVVVINPHGSASVCCFEYLDPAVEEPQISGIEPDSGEPGGGTLVMISGAHFAETTLGETTVDFGGVLAAEVVVVDDATITCLSPAGVDGETVPVTVINSSGSASFTGFTYVGTVGEPVISSIDPVEGLPAGGTAVTILGAQFTEVVPGETSVYFGAGAASEITVVDDMTITCLSPPGEGVVTVSVTNANGTGALTDSFTYLEVTETTPADVDGDGLMDLVIGAPLDDTGGEDAGSVHVYFSSGGLSSGGDLSASDADLIITGAASGDRFGANVATGDLNGDGDEDLIVAATHAGGRGMVYVFKGPLVSGAVHADSADHAFDGEGTDCEGSHMEDRFGSSVSVADVDGDGIEDLVVGAPGTDYAIPGASVFAFGLRSPMGLLVDPEGTLWVAQSGSGSADPADPEGTALDDAGVCRIPSRGVVEDVITGLPSITDEGFAGGTSDLLFDSMGSLVLVQQNGISSLSNSVLEFDLSAWTPGSAPQGPDDVVTHWDTGAFGDSLGYPHNNSYGVAEGHDGHLYVVDSGSNSIVKIERPSGVMSEFVTFPQVPQPSPFGPPFTDSVPTRILAHAGGFYVVNLTGFPFNDGAASVFNVDYSGTVTELVTGLSRATDVAVNPADGSLYVAQFDGFDLTVFPPWLFGTGSVARVTSSGLEVVAEVVTPTGVAFGADGTMFVSSMITGLIYSYEATSLEQTPDVGVVYVFRGDVDLSAYVHASSADITLGGGDSGDQFGNATGSGDFNGDGQLDLFVGAPRASTLASSQLWDGGAVYQWLGPVTASGSSEDADAAYSMLAEHAAMGASLAVGDINHDGLDDLIAAAPSADSEVAFSAGVVLVFMGGEVTGDQDASSADVIFHGSTANGGFGLSLGVADFSGDGVADIVATASNESYGAVKNGRAFLFKGGPGLVDMWAVAADVIFTGRFRDYEHFGLRVGAVDRDGDGVLDVCVSAFGGDVSTPGSGSVHLFRGGSELVDADADEAALTLEGEEELGRFGGSLSTGD